MSRPKSATVPATSQSALKGRRESSNNITVLQKITQSESAISINQAQETEAEDPISTSRVPRKRHFGDHKRDRVSQEQDQGEWNTISVTSPITQSRKRSKPTLPVESPRDSNHVILHNQTEFGNFFAKTNNSEAYLRDIQTLEVHLDASKLNEYTEFRLALALNELHPRRDGTNPHDLQTVRLVVKGNLLLTRYTYQLVSPSLSCFVSDKLKKLAEGRLSDQEKKILPYKINSTENLFAKTLLGIRGVKQVSIEGKGTMEADFAATAKATLVQPPGTDILETSNEDSRFSLRRFNKLGSICSDAYAANAQHPYPTVSGTVVYDFSRLPTKKRYLVDEKTELIGHFSDLDDHDLQAVSIVEKGRTVSRGQMPIHEVGSITKSSSRMRKTVIDQVGENKVTNRNDDGYEDGQEGLEFGDLVRIKKQKALPGDVDSMTLNVDVMPAILTAKEEAVELGWKL